MKMKMFIVTVFIMVLIGAIVALAVPSAPTQLDIESSTRRNYTVTGVSIGAQAGNVTRLSVQDNRTTNHWQGYYGTVSGEITLDNGKNETLYNWANANPNGEIYASNTSTVSWTNITCVNLTGSYVSTAENDGTRSTLNASLIENFFNITLTDSDGVNETFTSEFSGTLVVGSSTFTAADNCPQAYMYVNNMSQSSTFKEVLLSDNVSSVWTGILETDVDGFDGTAMDFQMMVPENKAEGITNYYFFVELS